MSSVGTIALGFAVHAIADAAWPRLTAGSSGGEGALAHAIGSWILLPSDPKQIANFAFGLLIAALLGLTLIDGVWRTVALVPTIYLAAFVWENSSSSRPPVRLASFCSARCSSC